MKKKIPSKCYTASPHVAKLMLYSFNSSCTLKIKQHTKKGFSFPQSPLLAHFGWLNTLLLCLHYWAITVVEQQHQLQQQQ